MSTEQRVPPAHIAEPLPPFNTWPVQLSDPDVGFGWYTSSGTLVTQALPSHATSRVSEVLSNWVDLVLEAHREEIDRCGGLLGIHDWRRFRSYDSEARRNWMQRIQRRPKGYLRKGVIIIADNPLIKMAVAGANMIVSLASGGHSNFEIATNATQILHKYDVRPPCPSAPR
jgi:hypothetical protein